MTAKNFQAGQTPAESAQGLEAARSAFERVLALHGAGLAAEAAAQLDRVLNLAPVRHDVLAELGMLALRLGYLEQGVEGLRRSLEIEPAQAVLWAIRGVGLNRLQRPAEALADLDRAIAAKPDFAGAYFDRACVLRALERKGEALADLDRSIEIDPANAAAFANRGALLHELGRIEEALESTTRSLALNPEYAQGRYNRAVILDGAGRMNEALLEFARVADHAPLDPALRGNALLALGRVEDAIACLQRACEIDAGNRDARSALLMAALYRESSDDGALARAQHEFTARFEAPLAECAPCLQNSRNPQRRLRIGYVSADFNAHSVAFFIEPVFARHDRRRFEIYAYHASTRSDEVTRHLCGLADVWVECAALSDERLAQRVRDDRIDILVDLSGHTAGNRRLVFARRPAPIQISWIGYPADPGPPSTDFLISDEIASPRSDVDAGASRLLRLPRVFSCYRAPTDAPDPAWPNGRDDGGIMFCSFNNSAKISPAALAAWARILHGQPGARLTLKDRSFADPGARRRLLERFAAHGIGGEQIIALARVPSGKDHLALYREADIALDTFPYNGVTTTCEALWMGVPVVSLTGTAFRSRMGATLLSAVGHPEWLADSEDQYVATALALARSEPLRRQLRCLLRTQMSASPLMDETGQVRDLEACYRNVWQKWCAS